LIDMSKEYRRAALECGEQAAQAKDDRERRRASLEIEHTWAIMSDDDPAKLRN
jgi:hypothetical protein